MLVNVRNSWWRRYGNCEAVTADVGDRPHWGGIDRTGDRDAMWRLVATLPNRQRAVLVLRYCEDLDDRTIAETLGCSMVTVRTNAMRALAALRTRAVGAGWAVREESR
jgi:DNA-directed RNA polymerase specialized sigma24 family protein